MAVLKKDRNQGKMDSQKKIGGEKMKRNYTRAAASILAAAIAMSLMGCAGGGKETKDAVEGGANQKEPVEISYATFMVGSHASAQAETEVIEEFNRIHEGEIKVVVEELPSDDAFVDKMKTLASSKNLPDVIIGKNGIRELAIENGQAVDLKPYLEEDSEWMKYVGESAMNYNTEEDGSVYSIANQRQVIGYFYNKDMFKEANITPAKTWDEWMENNKKLKDAGITPLALMTGENSWTTNLWLAAIIGTDGEEGNEFMNTRYPDTYNTDSVIKAAEMMQTCLKEYTTSDAVGAIYANAANNFEQGNTAMIANGPWMCPDFADTSKAMEGFEDKVGVALYPEDGLITQFEVGYVLCTNGKSEEEQAAALEFLKFKTNAYAQGVFLEKAGALPLTDNVEISDEYKAANPVVAELLEISENAKYECGALDNNAYESVVGETGIRYPELAYDEITPEEFADYLTNAAEQNK